MGRLSGLFESEATEQAEPSEPPVLQDWKLIAVGLHVLGGLLAAWLLSGSLAAGTVGTAMGAGIGFLFWFYIGTWTARKFGLELGLIPNRVYTGIVLLAAVLSSPASVVGPQMGLVAFIFIYAFLSILALLGVVIHRIVSSRGSRTGAKSEED